MYIWYCTPSQMLTTVHHSLVSMWRGGYCCCFAGWTYVWSHNLLNNCVCLQTGAAVSFWQRSCFLQWSAVTAETCNGESMTTEGPSHKYLYRPVKDQGTLQKAGKERARRRSRLFGNIVFWARPGWCTLEFTAAVVTYTTTSCQRAGRAHEDPPSHKDIQKLTADGGARDISSV